MMKAYTITVLVIAGLWYGWQRYGGVVTANDPLAYTKEHKNEKWADEANYYIGVYYYQRSDYPKAQTAFTQLLADQATSQYVEKGLMYLADTATETRDWTVAKESLAKYLEDYPQGKERERAKTKLEFIRYKHGE